MLFTGSSRDAIAAISKLAEIYGTDRPYRTAAQLAEERELPTPFVAKLMSMLARAGLVVGARGPGGGYTLARHPRRIALHQVTRLFEPPRDNRDCPFGRRYCGNHPPCPLHDDISGILQTTDRFLKNTHFDVFMKPRPR